MSRLMSPCPPDVGPLAPRRGVPPSRRRPPRGPGRSSSTHPPLSVPFPGEGDRNRPTERGRPLPIPHNRQTFPESSGKRRGSALLHPGEGGRRQPPRFPTDEGAAPRFGHTPSASMAGQANYHDFSDKLDPREAHVPSTHDPPVSRHCRGQVRRGRHDPRHPDRRGRQNPPGAAVETVTPRPGM